MGTCTRRRAWAAASEPCRLIPVSPAGPRFRHDSEERPMITAIPTAVRADKPGDFLRDGQNAREIVVDESIRELCHSLVANGFLQPVGAIDHGDYGEQLFGFRRMAAYRWGLREKLAVPSLVPVMLYPETITVTQRRLIAATENLQRVDLTDAQKFRLCQELVELNPGWSRKDLAAHLHKHASTVTQYLSPAGLIPEALEAFLAGEFGLTVAYEISKQADQAEALRRRRSGVTRDEMGRQRRKGDAPAERMSRLRCPLPSGVTVQVAGKEISLEETADALKQALKEVNAAIAKGFNVKTAQSVWKDVAKAQAGEDS
jgi:ParB-like chromosome segregation protein Spo0J